MTEGDTRKFGAFVHSLKRNNIKIVGIANSVELFKDDIKNRGLLIEQKNQLIFDPYTLLDLLKIMQSIFEETFKKLPQKVRQ